jgi:hypothetical protein
MVFANYSAARLIKIWKRGSGMQIKKVLTKNVKLLSLGGIISSWFTISMVWTGGATLPLVGFALTSGLFGLALLGGSQ